MAEVKRQPGYSRMWCKRCQRPLDWHRHRDTITFSAAVTKKGDPKLRHDSCGGTVYMSRRGAE